MRTALSAFAVLAATAALPAYADIVNGTFLTPPAGTYTTVTGTTIPGWTVTQGSVDWINTYWQQPPIGYSVDLDGLAVGAISQTIDTIINQTYLLSFWLAGNPDGPPDPKSVSVSADASSQTFTAPRPPSTANMGWTQHFFQFTATALSTTITFTSLDTPSSNPYGPALGDVSITSVPEASFYADFASTLGLGLIFMLFRRKRQA